MENLTEKIWASSESKALTSQTERFNKLTVK